MKTKIGIVFLMLIGTMCLNGHPLSAQTSSWSELKVANILSLRFPPTLELRDMDYATMRALQDGVNQFLVSKGGSQSDYTVVLQPQGLNTKGSSLYARVLINVNVDTSVKGTELLGLTDADVKEADAIFKKQYENYGGFKASWYGTTYNRYGGKYALVSHYDRAGLNGDVHVDDYRFFLKNYLVEITISYRKSESGHWKTDFNNIPSTLKFY